MKTHFPEYVGGSKPVYGSRAVVVVRNPIDQIVSLWHFYSTFTHSKSCTNDIPNEFPELWQRFVKSQALFWKEYYERLVKYAQHMPVYFVRYEDLSYDRVKTLRETFEFMFGEETIEGTYLEKRIILMSETGTNSGYKPRSGGVFNKNASLYSQEQREFIQVHCQDLLNFFEYTKTASEQNQFGIFERKDPSAKIGFREFNKTQKERYMKEGDTVVYLDEEKDGFQYEEHAFDLLHDIIEHIRV